RRAGPGARARSGEVGVVGEQGDLGPVSELQLGQDVGDVRLDGGHAQVELGGDLRVRVAVRDGEDDVVLTGAQGAQREAGAFRGAGWGGGAVNRAGGDLGGGDGVAGGDPPDRLGDLGRW